jgi:hypothetical protein
LSELKKQGDIQAPFNIVEMSIDNFKGISNAEIKNTKRINLFLGLNNAGKSTILEALRIFALLDPTQQTRLPELMTRRVRRTSWTSQDIFWNYERGSTAKISLTFDSGRSIGLDIRSEIASGQVRISLFKDGSKVGQPWEYAQNLDLRRRGDTYAEQFGNKLAEALGSIELLDTYRLTDLTSMETTYLNRLKQSGSDNVVSSAYSETYREGQVSWESLLYAGSEFRTTIRGLDRRGRFLDGFGDGARNGFLLLATANALKNTWLLVEEIENHQHPSALRALISQLAEIAEKNKLQVFITSHNPDVFRYCATQDNLSLHIVRRSEDGVVTSTSVSPSDFSALADIGWDFGNIIKAERFILVEGTNDVEFMKRAIHKIRSHWPHELGVTIIPYGGTPNLPTVLKALMFPNLQLHVVRDLDRDSQHSIAEGILTTLEERFRNEGYEATKEAERLQVKKADTGQVLELPVSNIHGAGDPGTLPGIEQHEFEDYIILIECRSRNIDPASIAGSSSKAELHRLLNSAEVEPAANVISKCDKANVPKSLSDFIAAITG